MSTRGRLAADSQRRYDTALAMFERHVDTEELTRSLGLAQSTVVTPLMFEYGLIERARSDRRHIVLPEGDDDRILRAAATVLARGIADLTILGEQIEVRARAIELGIDIQRRRGALAVRRRARRRSSPTSTRGCAPTRASPTRRPPTP